MRQTLVLFAVTLLPVWTGAGELEIHEIDSKALDKTMKLNVLLPGGYGENKERRYQAIYLLHGYGGDYTEWQRIGIAGEAAGLPAIIVMPEGDQSFYVNHHDNPKELWEDYITKEVVAFIDENYRTVPDREHRGISGLSMGGYGALVNGLRHPELFASAASHSGALGAATDQFQGEIEKRLTQIFGPEGSATREKYNPYGIIKDLPPDQRPHIYIDCGSQDFLLESNRKFVAHLSSLKVDYEYREVPGVHNFAYWKANVRYSLERQLEALKAAASVAKEKAAKAVKITGTWSLILKIEGYEIDYDLRIEESDGKLKGTLISPRSGEHPFTSVTVQDGNIHMEIVRTIQGNKGTLIYQGKLEGQTLSGKVDIKEFPDYKGEWKATRKSS